MQGKSENERRGVVFDASVFDGMINSQTAPSYSNLTHHCQSHRPHNYKPRPTVGSDDVIITSSPNAPPDNDVIIMSSPNVLPRPRMKLLQFHSNVRPPYFGSWRKKSKVISGRAPFKIDKVTEGDINFYKVIPTKFLGSGPCDVLTKLKCFPLK